MPTEMELTLEQTQQGVSYEVSVDPHGFEGTCKDGDGASFKSSSYFLQEMIDNQRSLKDRHGLGFTEDIASTSKTKIEKVGPVDKEMSTVELAVPVPSAREPTSSNEGNRISIVEYEILVSNVRLKVKLELDEWIKDSGYSRHMTGNKDLFSTYKAIDGGQICDKKCKVLFSDTGSEILRDDIPIGRGIRKNGLYIMKIGDSPKDSLCLTSIDDTSTLWHRRLGHANMRLIQSHSSKELVRNLPELKFKSHFCDACNIGKQVHASHNAKNMVSTTKCLELLHMDLVHRPFKVTEETFTLWKLSMTTQDTLGQDS
ncbi:retrovirus-related pol polyprotein from transposon TNT 1-94 [Tanacetum coccineum]|uniref:Retrovirus-related pol polyprotein from transposon TNT 1-94 n=1 Tax=Tanacetum coccineum TaxID=301880 RepID=A0ABQ5F4P9_9ASTR